MVPNICWHDSVSTCVVIYMPSTEKTAERYSARSRYSKQPSEALIEIWYNVYFQEIFRSTYHLNVVIFSDAARTGEKGQLGFIGGLMFVDLKQGYVFDMHTWGSHLATSLTISTGSAGIVAFFEAITEEQVITGAYQALFCISVHLCSIADSKDLSSTFSIYGVYEDKSSR